MHRLSSLLPVLAAAVICSLCCALPARAADNAALARENRDVLRVSAFVTAQSVKKYLADDAGREQAAQIFNSLGITRIWLDTYRDGYITPPDLMRAVRDWFQARGFDVDGGITTTAGMGVKSPSHRYFLCYNEPKTRGDLESIIRNAAPLFKEFIVDDFFATDCECEQCAIDKGKRTWGEYFRDIMVEVSRDNVVGAAKAVNPDIQVIIKYPQWYDRFPRFGYDVARQPGIFDAVWVGTETRDPLVENVQQYEAFVNYTWLQSAGAGKTRGAWFDTGNCYPEVFLEQAYQSVLAGAPELTIFGYTPENFTSDNLNRFGEKLPELFALARALKGKAHDGVFAYKPPNGDPGGDHYIFDYMGMLGLPLVMSAVFPSDARVAFISEHALADPDLPQKLIAFAQKGGRVILSFNALYGLRKDEALLKVLGIDPEKIRLKKATQLLVTDFGFEEDVRATADGYVSLGGLIEQKPLYSLSPMAVARADQKQVPVVLWSAPGHMVLNLRTYQEPPYSRSLTVSQPVFLTNMPQRLEELINSAVASSLGLFFWDAPRRVSFYLYKDNLFAMENFNDEPAPASIAWYENVRRVAALKDVLTGETISGEVQGGDYARRVFQFEIPARSVRLFEVVSDE